MGKLNFARRQYILPLLGIILLLEWSLQKGFEKIKNKTKHATDTSDLDMPYRAINTLDSSYHLIAYEFHKREVDGSKYMDCSAVIKKIDPATDDYKTICKSVIDDIVRTTGTNKIELSVYDNYEAYDLSEVKYAQQYKVLSKSESDSVDTHTVATYFGDPYSGYECSHTLFFYPSAHNRYTEKEIYEP